ncbi:hypothetical protein M2403_004665 [Rahnella sp. BIGb0603]|nr:hypothetical protein [Rahnella sp. BIGb0603]
MSQTVITQAFEQWKAQQATNGQAVVLDEFVFANVPNLDVNAPINRAEVVPPAAQIVYRQAVEKTGLVNLNAVVYSVTLGADVGDFSFNWIGLINKATGTLAMVVHAPLQSKVKNANGQQGNVLTRSFLMEYNGAESQTLISTPAETWQIDFTARLAGMDESLRLANLDIYGAGAFFDNGFLVAKTGTQFFVTAGLGYVGGLRANLAAKTNITVTTKPMTVWADVSYQGTLTSEYKTAIKFTLATTLKDYVQSGVAHYVFALASIDANGVITDLRPKGSSLYLRRDKNLGDIADPAAALNTLNGVPKTRTVNKKPLTADITLTPADVGAISNVMPNVDNTTVTKLYDPSIVSLSGGVTLAGYFSDHPLGETFPAADTLVSHRRWFNAGAALTQYLHCRTGTIYVRIGNVSTTEASGWAWVQTSASPLPFGWRKFFDSSSLELADLTRLGVAKSGDNSDITSLGKLTSIASSVKMAANLEVASSIQANYRVGVLRAGEFEAYMSFTSRAGKISAADLPASLTSMGNIYFRLPNTLTETDPHAGRALGGHSAAVYPTGEGVMRMDARDEAGAIKARIVCDGQTDSVHVSNGVLRPEWGVTLSSTNANSVIRGRNDAVILRDHNNGNITLSASLKDAGTQIGGTLYIGYNRPEANIFTSAVSVDTPLTVNETMKVVKDSTFAGAMTVGGEVNFNGLVKFNRHEATCQFSSSDAAYPLMNVNYSNAGNFGFWDATNGKWVLRKRASNLTTGNADNWVMESGGLEITGAYGLTLSTALPIASGGTGAKTAEQARSNIGAYPQSGGNVGGYVNATYLSATQPPNPGKEVQGTFIGWNETGGQGESDFVNNRGGGVGGFIFRTVTTNNSAETGRVTFSGTGDVYPGRDINTGGYIYERSQRVYSPSNPQPYPTDFNGINTYVWAYSVNARNPGDLVSGSELQPATGDGSTVGWTLGGTWRCMGFATTTNAAHRSTLWLRVG